jgi:transcriptional regulator with XRE-family HTH domain
MARLSAVREALGLTAFEMAARADCTVEALLRAEFGIALPAREYRLRLAAAYGLGLDEYTRLALDEAERSAG